MKNDELIGALVRDLAPVTPLPLPVARATAWAAAACALGGVVVTTLGLRSDLRHAAATPAFQAHLALLLVATFSAAGVALVLAMPGERLSGWLRLTPLAAVAAWLAWLGAELGIVALWHPSTPLAVDAGWGCIGKALAVGLAPGVVLTVMIGRGAPMDMRRAAMFAGLAAAGVGALGVELACPKTSPMHLLVWHAGPALALVLAATLFGGSMLSAVSSRVRPTGRLG